MAACLAARAWEEGGLSPRARLVPSCCVTFNMRPCFSGPVSSVMGGACRGPGSPGTPGSRSGIWVLRTCGVSVSPGRRRELLVPQHSWCSLHVGAGPGAGLATAALAWGAQVGGRRAQGVPTWPGSAVWPAAAPPEEPRSALEPSGATRTLLRPSLGLPSVLPQGRGPLPALRG